MNETQTGRAAYVLYARLSKFEVSIRPCLNRVDYLQEFVEKYAKITYDSSSLLLPTMALVPASPNKDHDTHTEPISRFPSSFSGPYFETPIVRIILQFRVLEKTWH